MKSVDVPLIIFITYFSILSVIISALPSQPGATPAEGQVGAGGWRTLDGTRTKLVAHRGEKVLTPEHTLPAYEIAAILGADYVEPDLCLTKDNVLVCFHDLDLRDGTDVEAHPEFDHLKHNASDGGYNWYIRDFTLAELRTLRVIQRNVGIRPQHFNTFSIPTFEEYIQTVHKMIFKLNRTIGVIPELKSPAFHNAGRAPNSMEQQVLLALSTYGYPVNTAEAGNCKATVGDGIQHNITCPQVIIQCFETAPLAYLKAQSSLELLHLVEEPELLTYRGMERVAGVAQYFSTWKEYVYAGVEAELRLNNVTWNASLIDSLGGFIRPQEFPSEAHRHGMRFSVYTIYDSREDSKRGCAIVPGCEVGNKTGELSYFFNLGVDNIFVENVAESREILLRYEAEEEEAGRGSRISGAPSGWIPNFHLFGALGVVLLVRS